MVQPATRRLGKHELRLMQSCAGSQDCIEAPRERWGGASPHAFSPAVNEPPTAVGGAMRRCSCIPSPTARHDRASLNPPVIPPHVGARDDEAAAHGFARDPLLNSDDVVFQPSGRSGDPWCRPLMGRGRETS
jgi:hypothetical protein